MKNALVLLIIVLCSFWLLWIKLNSVSAVEPKKAATASIASTARSSLPNSEREVYQALSSLIRVFESELTLDNLTPITAVLKTELPRMHLADRYRIYTQLQQALDAYTSQLNTEQVAVIERYTALRSQLSQQLEPQQLDMQQQPLDEMDNSGASHSSAAALETVMPTEPIDQQPVSTAPDIVVAAPPPTDPQNEPDQRQSSFVADLEQQWPQFLKQGLSSKQQQLLDALAKQHVEIAYAGEGSFAFRLNPNYWVKHVAPHLAKADQVYLQQTAEQTRQPYADDAGLLISWLELGQRVQVWAQYVQDYPDGYFIEVAQAKRDSHLNLLLVGMDNTPTYEQGILLPEVKAAYAQLMQQHSNSHLSRTLLLFEQQLSDSPADQPIDVPAAARRAIALAKDQISR